MTSSGSIRSCDIRRWDLQKSRVKDVAQVFGKRDSSFSVEPEARSHRCGITERESDYHYNKALIDPLVHFVALTLMPESPRTSPLVDRKLTCIDYYDQGFEIVNEISDLEGAFHLTKTFKIWKQRQMVEKFPEKFPDIPETV